MKNCEDVVDLLVKATHIFYLLMCINVYQELAKPLYGLAYKYILQTSELRSFK